MAVQTAAVAALEREAPAPPPGPPVLQLRVDGALVQPPVLEHGQPVVHTTELSYFSRLADHETFTRLALVETARRGVETAGVVTALGDGAGWVQAFIDNHRPDAVRILDWCHAVGSLGHVATACCGADPARAQQWLAAQTRELLDGDPDVVLGKLRGLHDDLVAAADPTAQDQRAVVARSLQYLAARRNQIAYARFRAAGYPIGSGAVESANKLVVEARLKGAGKHWARQHVDGMVALRTVVCSDRWAEAWPQIAAALRRQARARRRQHRQAARPTAARGPAPALLLLAPVDPPLVLALPPTRHEDPTPAPRGHGARTAPPAAAPARLVQRAGNGTVVRRTAACPDTSSGMAWPWCGCSRR